MGQVTGSANVFPRRVYYDSQRLEVILHSKEKVAMVVTLIVDDADEPFESVAARAPEKKLGLQAPVPQQLPEYCLDFIGIL